MNKLKKMPWYNKLIGASTVVIVVGNPLSLTFAADGVDLAFKAVAGLAESAIMLGITISPFIVAAGAVGILLGFGVSMGVREAKKAMKMKNNDKTPRHERKLSGKLKAGNLVEGK